MTDEERAELMGFRRQALLEYMRDISDRCWAAGWQDGLEADLYLIAFEGACPEYGMGEVTVFEQERLRYCATMADCWFSWCNDTKEPMPISLEEAKTRYQHIRPAGVEAGRTVEEVVSLYEDSGPQDWVLTANPEPEANEPSSISWLLDWVYRAHENYAYQQDQLVHLVRRHDLRFDLSYGRCDVRIVEPSWLPKEFPRADGCTPENPCGKVRRCVSCVELGGTVADRSDGTR